MKEIEQQKIPEGTDGLKRLAESLDMPVSAQNRLKARVMQAVQETGQEIPVSSGGAVYKRQVWAPRFAFAVIAGFAVLGGSVFASANSLPGDRLYPIKQAKEQLELQFAAQGQPKAMVLARHAEVRLRELSDLKNAPAEEIAKHQQEIRKQANTQVNSAVESLNRVKHELEDKGKTRAAAVVDETLSHLVASAKKAEIELEDKVGSAEEIKSQDEKKDEDDDGQKRPEGEVKGKWHKPETTDSKTNQQQRVQVIAIPKAATSTSSTATSVAPLLPNDSPNGAVLGTSTGTSTGPSIQEQEGSSVNESTGNHQDGQAREGELSEEQKQAQEKLQEQQKQETERSQTEGDGEEH